MKTVPYSALSLFLCLLAMIGAFVSCKKEPDAIPKSTEKSITAFSFASPAATATVDNSARAITGTLPIGTDASNLSPTIAVSSKATVVPASGTAQDFTKPVIYTVTAEDGSKQIYTATMTVTKATGKDLLTFSFNALTPVVSASINTDTKVISATMPVGTVVTALVPTITVSDRATVSPASGIAQDFSKTVTYTVTAEDGGTQAYTTAITVLVLPGVTTGAASGLTTTGFAMAGNLTATGSSAITQYGHVWSATVMVPTLADSRTSLGAAAAARTYSSDITGLSANTLYYVRAYATSAVGTVFGTVVQVRTSAAAETPTVTSLSANDILSTSARVPGVVNKAGTASVTAYGHCWSSTDQTPTIANTKTTLTASGTYPLNYLSELTSLLANTTYYVRAYATSSAGTAYGTVGTFKTANTTDDLIVLTDIKMTLKRGAGYSADAQPGLLNLTTGKVFTIGTGATNAAQTDLIIALYSDKSGYDDVVAYSPSKMLDYDKFWGDLGTKIGGQNWSIYKATRLNYLSTSTYPVATTWGKINTATDLANTIKNSFINLTISNQTLVEQSGEVYDNRLFVFQTREGKQGILRITDGQKKADSYSIVLEIKVQK